MILFPSFFYSDCFSDITLARQGYPRMAIAACFGGIIFSILAPLSLAVIEMLFLEACTLDCALLRHGLWCGTGMSGSDA